MNQQEKNTFSMHACQWRQNYIYWASDLLIIFSKNLHSQLQKIKQRMETEINEMLILFMAVSMA
jgi:hypothetical protein